MRRVKILIVGSITLIACSNPKPQGDPALQFSGESRLSNIRQLTRGGTNAEAYWSFDGKRLIFQHKGPGLPGPEAACDRIYSIAADGGDVKPISNGQGRTTCSYFFPDDERVLYSSTQSHGAACPPVPDMSRGYVWPIYDTYQLFSARADGGDPIPMEPAAPRSYAAEATVCRDGSVVFTSDRDGDLDLYVAKLDPMGTIGDVKRVTHALGYDGGAFFSPDCKRLVWRASRPRPGKEADEYVALLKQHLVKPGKLEIFVADADGSHARQVTRLGAASFAPYFTPDGEHVIFASNPRDPKGRSFDLYQVRVDGTRLERVTYSDTFESFPMFSPDGKTLAFASNRNARAPRETNLFLADWAQKPDRALTPDDADAADRFLATVETLSAPEMQGRGVATEGLKRAETFVEERFRKLGLKPLAGLDGYRQPIEISTEVSVDAARTRFAGLGTKDAQPAAFSAEGRFSGPVIDAGYGMVAPELGVDDYQGLKTKGAVVLVRRHAPKELKLTPDQERNYGDLRFKAFLARQHGAAAVAFWESDDDIEENLEADFRHTVDRGASGNAGLPAFFVSRRAAGELLRGSVTFAGEIGLAHSHARADNLVGWQGDCSAGSGRGAVLVGAHLDHLGFGGAGSLEPGRKVVHPGADDNASGVAAILEVARLTKGAKGCYVFAAFTAEETGVVGSAKLVELLRAKHRLPKAMLNLDMVGRLENASLLAFGSESAVEFKKLLDDECGSRALSCSGGGDGYGPSDHMSFYLAGVPVLHFFTGPHADYHRSTDTAEKINATGGVQVAEVVAAVARRAAVEKLSFVKAKSAPVMGRLGGGDRKSHGAYLGTIPDYSTMASPSQGGGVKLAGTRPGSPADQAGLKAGDILLSIAVNENSNAAPQLISSLEDFMYVLTALKPGQKIVLGVKRGETELKLPATVGKREK